VEAFLVDEPGDGAPAVGVRDRSGLSSAILTVSPAALELLIMMDGRTTCEEIRVRFAERHGQPVAPETITRMLTHLESAYLLEGEAFERHYQGLVEAYRAQPARDMPHAASMGITASGAIFDDMLAGATARTLPGRVRGVIAPHLDYDRGRPCYAESYAVLRDRPRPDRVVVLGTNHFGRSLSVVSTGKDFVTPLGRTRCDTAMLERLERACGDLRHYELDHAREHSVELQVAWLQHLYGAANFTIVPLLCPDPCGPTGTAPPDGRGVDLREFACALRDIADDGGDTLLVAGADLSHVGRAFDIDRDLDDAFLTEVRQCDTGALDALQSAGPEAFRLAVAEQDNPTNICSAGCIFSLATALADAETTILGYHQAVTPDEENCVTCCAAVFTA
jgi:AmmeMemoRadiSam system protein B